MIFALKNVKCFVTELARVAELQVFWYQIIQHLKPVSQIRLVAAEDRDLKLRGREKCRMKIAAESCFLAPWEVWEEDI